MTNYSQDADSVRVDFFRPSGKWYTTEAVLWTGKFNSGEIHSEFKKSLREHLGGRLGGMLAVCLHPYHQHEHPLMVNTDELNND